MRWLLYLLGALCALAAAFLIWEASYALAVAWRTHSWLLWIRFTRGFELLLPLHAAQSEWGNPVVQNLVARATLGATIAFVVLAVVGMQMVQSLRAIRPPSGGVKARDAERSAKGGFAEWQARLLDFPRALQRQGRALQRRKPHLREWPDTRRQGRRLRAAERPRVARLLDRLGHKARDVGRDWRRARGHGPAGLYVFPWFSGIRTVGIPSISSRLGPKERPTWRTSLEASFRRQRLEILIGPKPRVDSSRASWAMCSTATRCGASAR